MTHQHFNDFDIESSFHEEQNVDNFVIQNPLISATPPKAFKATSCQSRKEQLLSIVVHLDNGKTGYLITLDKKIGSWTCHACYPFKVSSLSLLEDHLINKMHLLEMGKSRFPAKNFIKTGPETGLLIDMPSMMSGEPIPPGMEDIVENVLARIQATLDSTFIPLIGIEFILELLPSDPNEEPKYMCALCDKRGDPQTFPNHLRSFNHHMAYLRRYFKTLACALEQLNKVSSKGFQELVFHVIGKIEEAYGRMKPVVLNASIFDLTVEKIKILRQVNNGDHIIESPEDLWMLNMITSEFVENPALLQEKFPLKKVIERNKREEEEKQMERALQLKMSFNKNPKIAVGKSQLRSKANKDSDSDDVEFVSMTMNTESKPRSSHSSSRDKRRRSTPRRHHHSRSPYRRRSHSRTSVIVRPRSRSHSHDKECNNSDVEIIDYVGPKIESITRKPSHSLSRDKRRRSPPRRRRRSKSPNWRRSRSKTPVNVRPRSRSRSHGRSRSRSHSSLYNRNYSSHRNRYRSRERISPSSSNGLPWSSMAGYVPRHAHRKMFYAPFPRPFKKFPPPGRPSYYNSAEYQPHKESGMSSWRKKIQAYEKAEKEMKTKMEKKLKYYENHPENHPMYQNEWETFWNQRFQQLQTEGKDTTLYDFKPEWILFWSKRMQEIQYIKMNEKTEKLKKKMLGDINVDKSSSESPTRSSSESPTRSSLESPTRRSSSESPTRNSSESLTRSSSPQKDKKSMVDSKISSHDNLGSEVVVSESDSVNKPSNDKKPKVTGPSPINSDSESLINELNKTKEKIQIENPLNIITVLRQLSVLENQLGLLAPKIMDLLSKSLIMEKLEPKSSMNLLTPENCVTFETVKEKLKGQLLAGVVKKSLANATMFSILNINKLMLLAPKFVPAVNMLNATITPTPTPIIVPGVGIIDKLSIAKKITNALLAQGKSNVTSDELETLINAVVGMAENNTEGAKQLLFNMSNSENVLKTIDDENDMDEGDTTELEELSQGDIINLLKNFTDLNNDEQDGLITYLKKLWGNNPNEMKKFRTYINMGPPKLQEVTSILKEDDDVDNYELLDVCKAVKEKVCEQENKEFNKLNMNLEITDEQQKLINSIQQFLPEITSDYSLQPINSQIKSNPDQSFNQCPAVDTYNTSYSLDPYSAKKPDAKIYLPQSTTSAQVLTTTHTLSDIYNTPKEQPTVHNIPQEQHSNKYNTPQELPNQYNNIPQELPNQYNLSQKHPNKYQNYEEQPNKYDIPQEDSKPYSVNQVDTYNDPYSQNSGNNYYQSQHDSYYNYQQNTQVSSYTSHERGGYYRGKNAYKRKNNNNTYPERYREPPNENNSKNNNTYPKTYRPPPNKNNRFNNFQSRH